MNIRLQALSESDGQEIYEMIREMGQGENGFRTNFPEDDYDQFKAALPRLMEVSKGIDMPEGYVPQTIYWMYADERPVAYGKLRHRLTDQLLEYGGHIGYSIRPSERGKGYGKLFLSELLKEAARLNLDKVLITCDEDNIRSRRVAEANGGKLEGIKDGHCKYWLPTSKEA